MRKTFCTLFDRNYLARALALIESLDRHEGEGYRLYAVCLDELTRLVLTRLANPRVIPVPLHALEERDPRLVAARGTRNLVEYYWTLTPTVLLWLLCQEPEMDVLTYVDADMVFFAPATPVLEELGAGAALIHRHRFSPDLAHLEAENGTYNVGLIAVRNDARGHAVLRWWRDRCLEWCYHRYEDGKMGDQRYLNAWPSLFPGVVVAQSAGLGTAPWNHLNAAITAGAAGAPCIGGEPIVCFHMHAVARLTPGLFVPARHVAYRLTVPVLRHCYVPYAQALARADRALARVAADFRFGLDPDAITPAHTFLAERALSSTIRASGIEHAPVDVGEGWDAWCSPQVVA